VYAIRLASSCSYSRRSLLISAIICCCNETKGIRLWRDDEAEVQEWQGVWSTPALKRKVVRKPCGLSWVRMAGLLTGKPGG
jgi:hypothetical protein